MLFRNRPGVTLLEMIIVIGIIGILAAVTVGTFSGSTESARAARCLSNMRSLASACHGYGAATGWFPLAGSVEWLNLDTDVSSGGDVKEIYTEGIGWLSWNSNNAYKNTQYSHVSSAGWIVSAYDKDKDTREYVFQHSALWNYVSGNRDLFLCPTHAKVAGKSDPAWSYVMNCYFGWDSSLGADASPANSGRLRYGSIGKAERRLLFAELPFLDFKDSHFTYSQTKNYSTSAGMLNDCTLQYPDNDSEKGSEYIGFNHTTGKERYGHVCFVDGHVEKLKLPKSAGTTEIKNLTTWLCEAEDISFDGKKYEKMTK